METPTPCAQPPVGRFAPSPTGPLHLGSLVTALASYLNIKSVGGRWLVRMEDIDGPRCVAGASDEILRCLETFGLHWDGELICQSERNSLYEQYWESLQRSKRIYPCTCPRHRIRLLPNGYDKHCLKHPADTSQPHAWRFITETSELAFNDELLGNQHFTLDDFIVKRKDKRFAYQFVVVVDDIEQGITEVVRGADLLDSTPRQMALFHFFSRANPKWFHLPLVPVDRDNRAYDPAHPIKLSKQHGAKAISLNGVQQTLVKALRLLGQNPPQDIVDCSSETILSWAIKHWNLQAVPKQEYYNSQA